MIDMAKFAVEINYNHYKSTLGILVDAKDKDEARGIAQRHFFKLEPIESIISTNIIEVQVSLIDTNPSKRIPDKKLEGT